MNVPLTPVSDTNRVFEAPEEQYSDAIFKVKKLNNGYIDDNIAKNKHYARPDYTRHVFSTMGNNVYTVDNRNIVLPIRQYNDVTSFGLNYLSKEDVDDNHGAGIYIVERYSIYDVTAVDTVGLVDYYRTLSDLSSLTVSEIESKIHNCTESNNIVIRIITYVPKKELDYYKYLYIPNNDLIITKGVPTNIIKHPKSDLNIETIKRKNILNDEHPTTISIDIVDNDNPYKAYYMPIGSSIQRLISTPSKTKPSGVKVILKKDGEVLSDRTSYTIDELDMLGIYDNESAAKYNGDIKLQMEDTKLNIATSKVIIEENKVKLSETQLNNEEFKRMHAFRLEELKYKTALEIAEIDKDMKYVSYKQTILKGRLDYIDSIMEQRRNAELHKRRLKGERSKNIANGVGMVATILKTIISFI